MASSTFEVNRMGTGNDRAIASEIANEMQANYPLHLGYRVELFETRIESSQSVTF